MTATGAASHSGKASALDGATRGTGGGRASSPRKPAAARSSGADERAPTAPARDAAAGPDAGAFEWSTQEEPHRSRRRQLMLTHAGARSLSGARASLKWLSGAAVLVQVFVCWLVSDMPWLAVLALAYTLGGTINHSQTLAMHETSHMLAFASPTANRLWGLLVNLPLGIPSFVSFRRYHMDHHAKQGTDGIDVDIATVAEGRLFTNAPLKLLWVLMQPLFYSLRPMIVAPKQPGKWEAINFAVCAAFDYAIFATCGAKGLLYLILGTLLGMGLHPMAGHFIAEHYTFVTGQETYSYYGPLNWLSYSVGYHNEHHDVPTCSFPMLPALRALAPELYETQPYHSSWVLVIWRYITDSRIGPFSRVKRAIGAGESGEGDDSAAGTPVAGVMRGAAAAAAS